MHLIVLSEGVGMWLRKWIADLEAQRFMWKCPDGKERSLNLAVREVKLLDIVFPREQFKNVLSLVQPYDSIGKWENYITLIRKALGLKRITLGVTTSNKVFRQFVRVCGIGVKEEFNDENGIEIL